MIELSFDGKNCPLVEQYEEKPKGIRMNGRGVYTFVAKVLPQYVEELVANAGMKAEDIDHLLHQFQLHSQRALKKVMLNLVQLLFFAVSAQV